MSAKKGKMQSQSTVAVASKSLHFFVVVCLRRVN